MLSKLMVTQSREMNFYSSVPPKRIWYGLKHFRSDNLVPFAYSSNGMIGFKYQTEDTFFF